jgi:hypothetical protein
MNSGTVISDTYGKHIFEFSKVLVRVVRESLPVKPLLHGTPLLATKKEKHYTTRLVASCNHDELLPVQEWAWICQLKIGTSVVLKGHYAISA